MAGSIAIGLLAMPAAAHESASAKRYTVMRGKASLSGSDWTCGHARIQSPHALFSTPPRDVCDHGDNAMIC
ncbi:hypothetical protein MTX26_16425 [Bradyrhizobium sp. ISRA443]|uniref:hypothetical protein n=1 Tax=unclassified Bradyrhizobium TaxID=2631580 RepID=UPI00247996E5|nr:MULTISPECIES: hypothetical protein [unclassified Bradyrhizobium]WGS02310.1 hypothetical protein MTX23_16435 [Bradyrhizobium sp. ISRA436]WGS09195.1 hypothetical protein MTX18_16425 [Bradyrhizobium sp. ISRA437]WGS16084.1 hypothetical protein MTX26_16425 [Bradyrhizobium sp. ISRA443]